MQNCNLRSGLGLDLRIVQKCAHKSDHKKFSKLNFVVYVQVLRQNCILRSGFGCQESKNKKHAHN